jgi:hypothetical protein
MKTRVRKWGTRVARLPKGIALDQLLAGVTKKNRHPEIATGPRQGKEA